MILWIIHEDRKSYVIDVIDKLLCDVTNQWLQRE